MSDRPCNLCIFREIAKVAKEKGEDVEIRQAHFPQIREHNKGQDGLDIYVNGIWLCWFMEIPARCAC